MKNKNLDTGCELLVLMDFSVASYIALKYSITIAKIVKSNIKVLHVINLESVVETGNAAVVQREISDKTRKNKEELISIVEIIRTEGIDASYVLFYGNTFNRVEEYIDLNQPDLIVLGKKKRMISGVLTKYLLHSYRGSVLFVGQEVAFNKETRISLARPSKIFSEHDPFILSELDRYTKIPLTVITVIKSSDPDEKLDPQTVWQSTNGEKFKFHYENRKSPTVTKGLIEHVSEKNIELLCVARENKRHFLYNLIYNKRTIISQVVNAIHIPILVIGSSAKIKNNKEQLN
jgi:nucleotide-binding universal stress UspA family protein